MATLKKQSLVDQIYDQIRDEIITLQIPLGSRLNVSELQDKYGVSSTPIREALNRLQKDNLVEYENNVGASVMKLEEKDVYEINELAMTLHSAAIRFAMKKEPDKAKMAKLIKKQIMKYELGETTEEWTEAVHDMIGVFYQHCGNSRLDSNMGIVKSQQLILRNIYGNSANRVDNKAHFEAVYEAVLANDTEAIVAAVEENSRVAIPIIIEEVKKMK